MKLKELLGHTHYSEHVMKRLSGLLGPLNASLLPKMLDDIGHPSQWSLAEEGDGSCHLIFAPDSNFRQLRFESEPHAVGVKWLLTAAWVSLNDDWSDDPREEMN